MNISQGCLATILFTSLAAQLPGQTCGEPPPRLSPISQAALGKALAEGESIRRRIIDAQQILGALASAKTVKKIDISDSTITGSLTLDASFHAPVTIKDSTVQQDFSLSGIKSVADIDLSGTRFDERVNIMGCRLSSLKAVKAEFHQPFSIVGSEIQDQLDMTNVTFGRSCSFRRVNIGGRSSFISSDFHQDARFLARFHGVNFSNALFRKAAVFDESEFHGPASSEFYETEFDELAKFMGVTLHPGATSRPGERSHPALTPLRFDTTRFNGDFALSIRRLPHEPAEVDFQDVLWRGRTYVNDSDMSKLQITEHCVMEKQLSLASSTIGSLIIEDSDLHGEADITNSRFDSIVFSGASFGGNVEFRDASWSKLDLENGHFEQGLTFAGACRGCPGFLAIQPDKSGTWHSVAGAAERGGNQAVANQAFYNEHLALLKEGTGNRFVGFLSRWGWGFGVRPLRTVLCVLGLILVFACFYAMQAAPMGDDRSFANRLERFESIILFSAKSTYRSPGRTLKAARSSDPIFRSDRLRFQLVVLAESVLAWVALLFFLLAADKVWPSLKEIASIVLQK